MKFRSHNSANQGTPIMPQFNAKESTHLLSTLWASSVGKHISGLVSVTLISQVFSVLRSLLLPILLSPAQLGVWNLMNVILSYAPNAHLGIMHGMNREIPRLRVEGNYELLEKVRNTTYTVSILLACIFCSGIFLCMPFISPKDIYAYGITAIASLCLMFYSYLFCLYRAESQFGIINKGLLLHSVTSFVFVVGFAYTFQNTLLGAMTGLLISLLIVCVYWKKCCENSFRFSIHKETMIHLFQVGLPLIVLGFLNMFFISIDRWFIASSYSIELLGYYALGYMLFNLIGLPTASVANVLYPKMLERFAQSQNTSDAGRYYLFAAIGCSALNAVCVIVGAFAVPYVILHFLPHYQGSLECIAPMLIAGYFQALVGLANIYLCAILRQSVMIKLCLISMLTMALMFVWATQTHADLRTLACVFLIGNALYALLSIIASLRYATTTLTQRLGWGLFFLLPLPVISGTLFL